MFDEKCSFANAYMCYRSLTYRIRMFRCICNLRYRRGEASPKARKGKINRLGGGTEGRTELIKTIGYDYI